MLWSYGNVIPYIASYTAYQASAASNHAVDAATYHHFYSVTNWSFFLLFSALTVGVLLGGKLELYFGPKIAICISALFASLGFGGTAVAMKWLNVYAVQLTYGVLFGFGVGLGWPVLAIVCMRWYALSRRTRTCR